LLTTHCYDISHHIKQSKYGAYWPLKIRHFYTIATTTLTTGRWKIDKKMNF